MIDDIGLMKPAAGVMATSPTTIPVAAPMAVAFFVRGQRAAGVEAEPSQPEQSRAEKRERYVLRKDRLTRVVLSRADDDRAHQRGRRGIDVNDRAAREIERAEFSQPPAA